MENARDAIMDQTVISPKIEKVSDTHYLVESDSEKGKFYHVTIKQGRVGAYYTCSCPQNTFFKTCKHAVQIFEILN